MGDRDARLDRLKAVAIGFVVVWHLHPIYVEHAAPLERAVRLFDLEISLTAVPTFLLVSLLLFFPKAVKGARSLARRLGRLGQIYLFWTMVQIAVAAAARRAWPKPALDWLWLGGPDIPLIGGSVFYYLFDLIALTALAFVFARLAEPWRRIAGWILAVSSLAYFEWAAFHRQTLLYWQLQNFVVYIPAAFYLSALIRYRYAFLAGYLIFAAQDLYLGHAVDCVYGRVSIACGALALVTLTLARGRAGGAQPMTRAIAGWSLGLYAVHKYWQYLWLALKGGRSFNVVVLGATVHLAALALFVATLAATALTVYVLRATPLRRFVT